MTENQMIAALLTGCAVVYAWTICYGNPKACHAVKVWLLDKLAARPTRSALRDGYEPEHLTGPDGLALTETMDDPIILGTASTAPYPHCDDLILHAPGECQYCDAYPSAQLTRVNAGINFTNHDDKDLEPCPSLSRRNAVDRDAWVGNRAYLPLELRHPEEPTITIMQWNKPLVTIRPDGTITYGKDYTPELAAKIFWEALAANFPVCVKCQGKV